MFGKKYKQLYLQTQVNNKMLLDMINNGFNPLMQVPFKREAYKNMLVSKDRILCTSRYIWSLPINLKSTELEGLLYQYGSLCMFEDDKGKLTFSRYAKQGELNPYGQLDMIQPIDFSGHPYGSQYSVINSDNMEPAEGSRVAVIMYDYTPWLPGSDGIIPRAQINLESTIGDQIEVYNQLLCNIYLSVKKALALCDTEDQKNTVMQQARRLFDPNCPLVAVSSQVKNGIGQPVQMFNFNNTFDTQNYCQTIEFYDKVRRGFDGIPAPDVFEKKERMITSEAENSGVDTDVVLQDGLKQRQDSIELFKKYAKNPENKNISVEISEALKPKKAEPSQEGDKEDGNDDKQDVQA